MATFEAVVRVVHLEIWTVEAADEEIARQKIRDLETTVETDETGGETIDWEVESIKRR